MSRPPIPSGGEGPVTLKRINGEWRARLRWRDFDGGYHEATITAPTRHAAIRQVRDRVDHARDERERRLAFTTAVAEGNTMEGETTSATAPDPTTDDAQRESSRTLHDVAMLWLQTLLDEDLLAPSTVEQYRRTFNGTLSPALNATETDLDSLTRHQVSRAMAGLIRRDHHGNPRLDEHGNTIPLRGHHPRVVLKLLLDWVADDGLREDATDLLPARQHRRRGRKAAATRPLPRAITDQEWQTLQQALRRQRLDHPRRTSHAIEDVTVVLWWTGLRLGELLALRRRDITGLGTDDVRIHVADTITDAGQGHRRARSGARKSGGSLRIRLHADAAAVIERRLQGRPSPDALVLATRNDTPLWDHNLRTQLREVTTELAMPWLTFHSFRDTLADRVATAHPSHRRPSLPRRRHHDRHRPHRPQLDRSPTYQPGRVCSAPMEDQSRWTDRQRLIPPRSGVRRASGAATLPRVAPLAVSRHAGRHTPLPLHPND